MAQFAVQLAKGETVYIDEADAYQFEGPLTTFFSTGSSRQVIDSWSTRVASYRTADVLSIERFDMVLPYETGEPEVELPITGHGVPAPTESVSPSGRATPQIAASSPDRLELVS